MVLGRRILDDGHEARPGIRRGLRDRPSSYVLGRIRWLLWLVHRYVPVRLPWTCSDMPVVGSYSVLFVSVAAHAAQFAFLLWFENPRKLIVV